MVNPSPGILHRIAAEAIFGVLSDPTVEQIEVLQLHFGS
jgi:hypothetical protein